MYEWENYVRRVFLDAQCAFYLTRTQAFIFTIPAHDFLRFNLRSKDKSSSQSIGMRSEERFRG